MERPAPFKKGEVYYVSSHCMGRQDIFLEAADCDRMMLLLYLCNTGAPVNLREHFARGLTYPNLWEIDRGEPIVEIGAWCLMPDHFQLLIREIQKGGISKYMLKVATAYSMYFNKKMARKGPLLRGPYRAEHVSNNKYLHFLFSFIHLSPVGLTAGEKEWKLEGIKNITRARSFLEKYPYSSLPDHMKSEPRSMSKMITPAAFPWKYDSIESLNIDLLDWLSYSQRR